MLITYHTKEEVKNVIEARNNRYLSMAVVCCGQKINQKMTPSNIVFSPPRLAVCAASFLGFCKHIIMIHVNTSIASFFLNS